MAPRTTRDGLNLIKTFEGEKLVAYLCPAGVWTIGVGHTSAAGLPMVVKGMKITPQESDAIFQQDIDRFENQVESLLAKAGVTVAPYEFDALVSLAFNIGIGAFRTSSVFTRLARGDRAGAAAAFLKWTKAKTTKRTPEGKFVTELVELPGLVRRRQAEKLLFEGEVQRALEKAMYAAGTAMPRKVARPTPPKTMATSKTGNAAVATGSAGALVAVEAAREAVHQAQSARDSAQSAGELFGVSGSTALILGAAVIIIAAAAFIWWDRRRKLREDLV